MKLGKLEDAEFSYRKAIKLNPNYAQAYNNLAFPLKELGRLNEAKDSLMQAIVLKPEYLP